MDPHLRESPLKNPCASLYRMDILQDPRIIAVIIHFFAALTVRLKTPTR